MTLQTQIVSLPKTAVVAARECASVEALTGARETLRAAARLPYSARHPETWLGRFTQHARAAQRDIEEYMACATGPDSPVEKIIPRDPRLAGMLAQQRAEHVTLLQQSSQLCLDAAEPGEVDVWRMIDLGEKAILLEIALARHSNRLQQLQYESRLQGIRPAG